jgi:serine/threonine protein kinase
MKINPCLFLVKQFDVFRTDQHLYIVMELCSGGSLEN